MAGASLLSAFTGGGGLTPSSSAGPATSGSPVTVGGVQFAPSSKDQLIMLATVAGLAVSVITLVKWARK